MEQTPKEKTHEESIQLPRRPPASIFLSDHVVYQQTRIGMRGRKAP